MSIMDELEEHLKLRGYDYKRDPHGRYYPDVDYELVCDELRILGGEIYLINDDDTLSCNFVFMTDDEMAAEDFLDIGILPGVVDLPLDEVIRRIDVLESGQSLRE